MMTLSRITCISMLAVCCAACSGGGIDISIDPPPPPPAQPQVTVEGQMKQLVFSWAAVPGTDQYRLMENADGHSGFTQVGDNIPSGTLSVSRDIAVHLFDWVNAQYVVEACNTTGCSDSDVVTVTDVMLDSIGYVKASDPDEWDRFWPVALSADGTTLAVGAPYEDSSATGINGDQADNSAENSGAVYLFRFDGTDWSQQAYIKASNTDPEDYFGLRLALSADGNTLAVGTDREGSSATGIDGDQADNSAELSGAVYLFRFDGADWYQQTYLKASNTDPFDKFGCSVALSADGNTLAVGAAGEDSGARGIDGDQSNAYGPNSGAVYVFRFDGTDWYQQAYVKDTKTNPEGLEFGTKVALSADGDTLAVGAPDEKGHATGVNGDENHTSQMYHGAGAAYLFRFDGTDWYQQAYVKASNTDPEDYFGLRLALSSDGSTLAVVAPGEKSSATGINGDQSDNSDWYAGAVYLFRFDGADWYQQAYVKASETYSDNFGISLSLSADGDMLVVGASYDYGAAYIYRFELDNWVPLASLREPHRSGPVDSFAGFVALSDDTYTLTVTGGTENEPVVYIY